MFLIRLLMLFGAIAVAYAMYGPQGAVWTTGRIAQDSAQDKRDQEKADCIERYRKGQRKTVAGC
jgi:hypothetical protein